MMLEMRLEHLLYVVHEMGDEQWDGIQCLYWSKDKAAYAAMMYGMPGIKVTIHEDGEPWVCGGLSFDGPGRGTLWMAHRPGWEKYVKQVKRAVHDMIEKSELRCIQALVLADNPRNNNWVQHLGMAKVGFLEAYGDGGQDFNMYALVHRGN